MSDPRNYRYKPRRSREGYVTQSGLDQSGGREGMQEGSKAPNAPRLGLYRAVVLNTYVSDSAERKSNGRDATTRTYEIECDVLTVKSKTPLYRVPVAQRGSDQNNVHGMWIPKPSTKDVTGNKDLKFQSVSSKGTGLGTPPKLEDLDGENVIIQFVEGDPDMPLITHSQSHTRTKRLAMNAPDSETVRAEKGWREGDESTRGAPEFDEYYLSHYGTEVRLNDQGDMLIDLIGAFKDRDTEEATGTDHGQMRIRIRDGGQKFTIQIGGTDFLECWKDGANLVLDIGEGATERLARGDKLVTWLLAHDHPTAMGQSAPATNPTTTGANDANDIPSDNGRIL